MNDRQLESAAFQRANKSSATILIADDDATIRTVLAQALVRAGYQVRSTSNASTLWKWVKEQEGDLVLTDVMMPDGNIFDILPKIRYERPKLPIIVMSAQNTLLTAVSAAEQGVYEYLPKPFDLDLLISLVKSALEPIAGHRAIVQKRRAMSDENLPLIGRSAAMQEVYRTVSRVAPFNLNVHIEGETGVGKALIARTIHDFSQQKGGNFVSINAAGMAPNEIDKALMGLVNEDEKGAKIDAGSTLYFANVDDAQIEVQARILSAIEKVQYSGWRVISSSTKNLLDQTNKGEFRKDLYYLLSCINLKVPALRERTTDIGDLARLFLTRAGNEGLGDKVIDNAAINELENAPWHGNVRELQNLMFRLAALSVDKNITANVLRDAMASIETAAIANSFSPNDNLADSARKVFAGIFANSRADGKGINDLHAFAVRTIEKPLFELTLKETKGNQIKAAEILGLNRNTLRKRLSELNFH